MTEPLTRRCLWEALGTAVLVGVGTGAVVAAGRVGGVSWVAIAAAWFVAVAVPVLLFASRSGAHLNPAVTLSLVVARRFSGREAVPYASAQLGGAFLGSLTVLALLGTGTHLGATLPSRGLVVVFVAEATFTTLLLLTVMYLTRPATPAPPVALVLPAVAVGVSTYVIGPLTGSSLNPARSIAPAVLSGAYGGLWVYLIAQAAVAVVVGFLFRPRATPSNAGRR